MDHKFIQSHAKLAHCWITNSSTCLFLANCWSTDSFTPLCFLLPDQWQIYPLPNISCSRMNHKLIDSQTFLAPRNISCSQMNHKFIHFQTFLAPRLITNLFTPKHFLLPDESQIYSPQTFLAPRWISNLSTFQHFLLSDRSQIHLLLTNKY